MGKSHFLVTTGYVQGRCRKCRTWFVGPGDRCPSCAQELRKRKRRKPR